MKKAIKVAAIIAVVLVALAMFLLLLSIPFQRVLANKVFGFPADSVCYLPIFPWVSFVFCLLLLGCVILTAVCAGKKGIILPEILLLIVLIGVIPGINRALPSLFTVLWGHFKGDIYVAANSIVTQISSYCMIPATLGNSLALVACGMNIVHKRMSKQLDKPIP